MNSFRSHIILFSFIFFANTSTAQFDLTGTWEGIMGRKAFDSKSGQYLQISIVQQCDKICGYTFDSVIARRNDHCKAVFQGEYDKRRDLWILTGTSFIENSGTHVFMRITLWNEKRFGKDKLEGLMGLKSWPYEPERPAGIFSGLFRLFGLDEDNSLENVPEDIRLKRVSSKAPEMPPGIASCFPNLQKRKDSLSDPVVIKSLPPKPADTVAIVFPNKDSAKQVVVTPPVIKKNDTVAVIVPQKDIIKPVVLTPSVVKQNDTVAMVQKMATRKNTTITHLPIDVKFITLNIYDNAIYDGDTVTIFYNGKLLVNKRLLSSKPIVIELALDEKSKTHEIVMYAENLGSIPPNTALIVVNAGGQRYELHASASLEENAVLVFDYEPRKN